MEEGCVLWGIRTVIPKSWREKLLQELHQPSRSDKDEVSGSEFHVLARTRQRARGFGQGVSILSSSEAGTIHGSPTPMGVAIKTLAANPPRLCRAVSRIHVLIVVDAYSKWPEVRIMSATTSSKTLEILREWFASNGTDEHLVTDNGPL